MLALPPSVSFVAGAYTENDSSLVAGGHVASWKDDSIRYAGIAAYGDLNFGFYGTSPEVNPDDIDFGFNIKGFYLLQEIIFRYRDSNLFAGGRYSFLTSDVSFDLGGDIPSYDVPFIAMRGIQSFRYQGDDVLVGELELRWNVTPRWSLLGFFGSGWTADSIGDLMSESGETAGGVGFRYLIARRYGLRVGIDVAAGPEDEVAYLAVGANWK